MPTTEIELMKSDDIDRQLLEMFTHEVRERAADIERTLIAIEDSGEDTEKRLHQEKLLRTVHSLKGAAGLVQVRGVETICHWMEEALSLAVKQGRVLAPTEVDLLLKAADAITEASGQLAHGEVPLPARLENVVLGLKSRPDGEGTAPESAVSEFQVPFRSTDIDGSMRVSAERLDALLHRSGELLSWHAALRQHAQLASLLREKAGKLQARMSRSDAEVANIESDLRTLAASLRRDARLMHGTVTALGQEVRHARTQPFGDVCQGLPRVVRDMAAAGKSARLEIRGGEIEIDRSILAGLQDSLRHLVRNAVAHGIEPPAERRAAGKPETGLVVVSASIAGDRVQVMVQDDGRGLDTTMRHRLAERSASQALPGEGELIQHVFEPGVSTAPVVTSLAGRGIGLDIVRSAVEAMRGTATVAQPSEGGTTFTLTLPLTLATVQALEVVAAGHAFTIDTASVERVVRLAADEIAVEGGRRLTRTKDGPLPVIDLAGWLGLRPSGESTAKTARPAVVVGMGGKQAAILVDEIAGQQELLARSFGSRLARVRRYCGGMVLPDGRIALLLNTAVLIEATLEETPAPDLSLEQQAKPGRRKVLVVDDSKYIRTLVRLILEGAGYDVVLAADGSEALAHLADHGADILVADVDMPTMDGFELTETIRGSERHSSLPIVLVTGRDTPADEQRGLRLGANAYLKKSGFDAQQFLETMSRVR